MMKILLLSFIFFISPKLFAGDILYKETIDLGISSGSVGNINYTEFDLGLNLYFSPYLNFRNAVFNRFGTDPQNFFGLDTSVRGVYSTPAADFGFTVFAGPGARIPSKGNVTPFAEGGLILKVFGLGAGIGAKLIQNSWVTSGVPNETQVFFILAIGGGI